MPIYIYFARISKWCRIVVLDQGYFGYYSRKFKQVTIILKLSHLWHKRKQLLHHAATKYPVYVFHHLPKCGGTSMVYSLRKWFVISPDYVDVKEDIFKGPFPKSRHRIFSFIRDPLEMRCSFYRHKKKFEPDSEKTLAESIMEFPNYYSRILRVNQDNYQEKLDRYYYFGIYEELQESFDVFASKIGKPRIELPFENTTKKSASDAPSALTQDQLEAFKESSALDYKIYEYAKQRYESDKSEYLAKMGNWKHARLCGWNADITMGPAWVDNCKMVDLP